MTNFILALGGCLLTTVYLAFATAALPPLDTYVVTLASIGAATPLKIFGSLFALGAFVLFAADM